jgi:hypothetical protein
VGCEGEGCTHVAWLGGVQAAAIHFGSNLNSLELGKRTVLLLPHSGREAALRSCNPNLCVCSLLHMHHCRTTVLCCCRCPPPLLMSALHLLTVRRSVTLLPCSLLSAVCCSLHVSTPFSDVRLAPADTGLLLPSCLLSVAVCCLLLSVCRLQVSTPFADVRLAPEDNCSLLPCCLLPAVCRLLYVAVFCCRSPPPLLMCAWHLRTQGL